jgi:hypothetical protein
MELDEPAGDLAGMIAAAKAAPAAFKAKTAGGSGIV